MEAGAKLAKGFDDVTEHNGLHSSNLNFRDGFSATKASS